MSANTNTNANTNANADPPTPPENFKNIITDFISSFLTAFPEYTDGVHAFINSTSHAQEHITPDAVARLFAHCQSVYPERFFDILYQNDNIFSPDAAVSNDVSVDFLPGVDFRIVWNLSDISDKTKERIWKHLQLITFTIVSGMSQGNVSFGDTAKMFEAINEEELRVKLEETMANLQSMFEDTKNGHDGDNNNTNNNTNNNNNNTNSNAPDSGSRSGTGDNNSTPLPDAEKMHEHLSGLLDGKIGALAKEIAEETITELDIDVSEETSVSGVFQKLMKNPGKLAGIVKKVGEKLDKKMKSGDIKESELFKEASDFMSKMKGSGGGGKGGMGDIAQLLKSMNLNMGDLGGLGGGGGGGGGGKTKVNLGAMQSQLGRNLKMAQNKERMQKKLEEHRAAAAAAVAVAAAQQPKQMKHSVYQPSTSDRNEKTPRVTPGAVAAIPTASSCETSCLGCGGIPGCGMMAVSARDTPATSATPATVNQSLETANDAPEKKKKHKNKNKK